MISGEQMAKAIFFLESAGLVAAREGQTMVWLEVIRDATPNANDEHLMMAVRKIAKERTSDSRSGSWVIVGDLVAAIKAIRNSEIEAEERRQRQIESGRHPVVSIDARRLMVEGRDGVSPEEIGRRARERAEGSAQ